MKKLDKKLKPAPVPHNQGNNRSNMGLTTRLPAEIGNYRLKGAVERHFRTLNGEFLRRLPGHINTTGKNRDVNGENTGEVLTLLHLQEKVHQWTATHKRTRKQKTL
jgi:hypothetical protein